MQGSRESMKDVLQTILLSCKDIHQLLLSDKDLFIKNNMNELQVSNSKKTKLLTQLNQLIENLKAHCAAGLLEQISQVQDIQLRSELQKILEELQATLSNCYKIIAINSNTIFTNVNQLKNLWDKLLSFKSSQEAVYDHTGAVK